MGQRTCSINGCGRPHDARGYCGAHYLRWSQGRPLIRPCVTCGVDVVAASGRDYCSESHRPACSEDGCERRAVKKGLCIRCYGDRRAGRPRAYRWATEKRCIICGATEWSGKGRKVCSPRCQQLLARNGGEAPPSVTDCVRCGSVIDLTRRGKAGRKKRADTKMCDWCKGRRHLRHKVSVMDVVNAHGSTDCGICGGPVDLNLRHPDLFRASIDHVLPYARGGTHDLDNLQVAHLYCNYVKSDREGFTL